MPYNRFARRKKAPTAPQGDDSTAELRRLKRTVDRLFPGVEVESISPSDKTSTSKFHNKKVLVDGISFDSKREGKRYLFLKEQLEAGEIRNLRLQPVYELQPKFKLRGKTIRAITYRSDFEYEVCTTGQIVTEDAKGMKTEAYKIKAKIFQYRYPDIELREV